MLCASRRPSSTSRPVSAGWAIVRPPGIALTAGSRRLGVCRYSFCNRGSAAPHLCACQTRPPASTICGFKQIRAVCGSIPPPVWLSRKHEHTGTSRAWSVAAAGPFMLAHGGSHMGRYRLLQYSGDENRFRSSRRRSTSTRMVQCQSFRDALPPLLHWD